ncbi:SPOR domain-containing protein [Noviherbaspirillum cavernae]|uniref:SPOR domain-containing protein n=1 Tax=Noviherbaspirillum cavernae TaxID=2320862 RepID=A0A418X512_9BURK|nr:SPOR domain-containing protein [Noviherbaspirillum cavernae]RJG07525.1 SPOR domain-containing protein [Noviherbaspirillum cavernae]
MHNHINKQRGGTILGIIIGLIIGLGIALAVAMAITKSPMPFTNKVARQEKAGPTASQSADPNKPLYGKAAKAAPREIKEADSSEQPAPAVEKKPEVKPATAEAAAGDKPKKAEIKTADVKATEAKDPIKEIAIKSESADDKWAYYLQAGAFRESTDAENARAKLALMGVEARVSERQSENGILYRVRVGPFVQLEAVNRVRGKLSDNGVDAAVVRIAKQH